MNDLYKTFSFGDTGTTLEEASVFSFTYEDIELEDALFGLNKFRIVRCPVCKEKNYLEKIIIHTSGSEDEKRSVL